MWRRSAVSRFSSRISLSSSSSSSSPPNPRLIPWSRELCAVNTFSQPPVSSEPTPKLAISGAGSDPNRVLTSRIAAAAGLGQHYARCYWELSKARLSMLVVATSGTGYILGTGNAAVDLAGLCYTCAGTMMIAASANSLNQIFEISNDAKMKRTMKRPLPSGRISVPHAVAWATIAGTSGACLLASKTNMMAAGLASANLVLYAFVYTPLKQIHPINTWVGAVVGAIPPLLGWAAASGEISLNSLILPAALYFWQIPHFMALAHLCRNDYAAGGYKMLSLFDPSGKRIAAVALRTAFTWGLTSSWFCLESTLLTMAIAATAFSFYRHGTMEKARKMFHASLLFLPVFMSGLLIHRVYDEDKQPPRIKTQRRKIRAAQPPVAYASAAPFPFLPAPSFYSP
ncbi:hypothetical protein Bca52824_096801 [Brassica carinata]|uniref:Heme O synthase n=1 Tax=Brassica carinata TaxID=52824 RepID=A0A8X7TGT6_BRACI|nr:hypothetical protein Bca52824_096801 [Brassica carinata]